MDPIVEYNDTANMVSEIDATGALSHTFNGLVYGNKYHCTLDVTTTDHLGDDTNESVPTITTPVLVPSAKPVITVSDGVITVSSSGSAIGDSVLVVPGIDNDASISSATLAYLYNGDTAITKFVDGWSTLQSYDGTVTEPNGSYLFFTENGNGASAIINGDPFSFASSQS